MKSDPWPRFPPLKSLHATCPAKTSCLFIYLFYGKVVFQHRIIQLTSDACAAALTHSHTALFSLTVSAAVKASSLTSSPSASTPFLFILLLVLLLLVLLLPLLLILLLFLLLLPILLVFFFLLLLLFFFFFSLHDSSSSLLISLASHSVGAQDEAACQRSAGSPLAASPLMLLLPLFLCSLGSVALLQLLDAARVPVLLPCLRFFVFVNPASSSRSIRPSFRPPACHFLPFLRRHSLGVAWC